MFKFCHHQLKRLLKQIEKGIIIKKKNSLHTSMADTDYIIPEIFLCFFASDVKDHLL